MLMITRDDLHSLLSLRDALTREQCALAKVKAGHPIDTTAVRSADARFRAVLAKTSTLMLGEGTL